MNQKLSWLVGIMMMSTAINAQANIIVTPYIGYTGGGQVEDESGNTYDLDPAVNYALSVETPLEKGRIGLFYSNQSKRSFACLAKALTSDGFESGN